jgi:hypothetical protein
MSNVYYKTIPEVTTEKMRKFLREQLDESKGLFKYDTSRLDVALVIENAWFGNITADGIINRSGISDLKITSLNSLTATINVFYDQSDLIASYIVIYFDDDNIIIPDFEFITLSMNLSICDKCSNHKNVCGCNVIEGDNSDKVKEIMNMINRHNLSKTTLYDPSEILYQERRIDIVEEVEEVKPAFDMAMYEPIIIGISTTLKYNKKKVEEAAIKILTSNPDMPDNQLATEIIRNLKG